MCFSEQLWIENTLQQTKSRFCSKEVLETMSFRNLHSFNMRKKGKIFETLFAQFIFVNIGFLLRFSERISLAKNPFNSMGKIKD